MIDKYLQKSMDDNIEELKAFLEKDSFPYAVRSAWHIARAVRDGAKIADASAQRIITLTMAIRTLTIVLVVLTVALVALELRK